MEYASPYVAYILTPDACKGEKVYENGPLT